MNEEVTSARSPALAVIMERTALRNRWVSEKWEAKGVVPDIGNSHAEPRVIVAREDVTQILFPGFHLKLTRDEAEGYFLNLTSPEPKIFVLWRMTEVCPGVDLRGEVARPQLITASYGEGTRWADSGEQVDGVALPRDVAAWLAEYVKQHYRPEPPKKKRYASNKDRGRMGHVKA